jgi:hypothetical protein
LRRITAAAEAGRKFQSDDPLGFAKILPCATPDGRHLEVEAVRKDLRVIVGWSIKASLRHESSTGVLRRIHKASAHDVIIGKIDHLQSGIGGVELNLERRGAIYQDDLVGRPLRIALDITVMLEVSFMTLPKPLGDFGRDGFAVNRRETGGLWHGSRFRLGDAGGFRRFRGVGISRVYRSRRWQGCGIENRAL